MKVLSALAAPIVAVLLGSVMRLARPNDAQHGTWLIHESAGRVSRAAEGCKPKDEANARAFAVGVMQCLVGYSKEEVLSKGETPDLPEWERIWSSKCEVGIACASGEDAPTTTPGPLAVQAADDAGHAVTPTSNHSRQLSLLRRAVPPVQLMQDAGVPNLTSVLFNKTASDAIRVKSHLLGGLRAGTTPMLPTGSIIAKAIWGIVQFDEKGSPKTKPGSFYVSTMTNDAETGLSEPGATFPDASVLTTLTQSKPGWEPYRPNATFDAAKVRFNWRLQRHITVHTEVHVHVRYRSQIRSSRAAKDKK